MLCGDRRTQMRVAALCPEELRRGVRALGGWHKPVTTTCIIVRESRVFVVFRQGTRAVGSIPASNVCNKEAGLVESSIEMRF